MTEYRLSPLAEQDMETILEWTHEEFGEKARIRYEALLTRAIMDVTEAPERMGSHDRPEIAAGARTCHLRNSGPPGSVNPALRDGKLIAVGYDVMGSRGRRVSRGAVP